MYSPLYFPSNINTSRANILTSAPKLFKVQKAISSILGTYKVRDVSLVQLKISEIEALYCSVGNISYLPHY